MPTILLEQIIELLTGWKDSFFSWANDIGDKIASIKTNTDSLPDIESNTDDIKDNTAAVITPISNINSNVVTISSEVSTIKTDTGIIKNNASAIATSSGAAAAFAEDVANNTLEVKNKITTIASDTTQMRSDSGSIRADVSEIKNTLGLYLYNTIVTEDADGPIANFDTDLQDYLQKALVDIPADAGGISECKIGYVDFNQLVEDGNFSNGIGWGVTNGSKNVSDNILSYTVTTVASGNANRIQRAYNVSYVTDHKYFISYDVKTPKAQATSFTSYSTAISASTLPLITKSTPANKWFHYAVVANGLGTGLGDIRIGFHSAANTDVGDTSDLKNVIMIDLTQAFGTNIADYLYSLPDNGISYIEKIFTKNYYAFNTGGTIVSVESVNGSYYPNASVLFGSSITDGGSLDLTTGLLTVNTTPPTLIQLAPAPIKTLKGLNSIWADCGNIEVTYRETLKHYLEKQQ